MDPSAIPTDLVPVLSSVHGRQRRQERNITKKDLQTAVKYGTKEFNGFGKDGRLRWRYKHNGIVYVTDATSQYEVTSWVKDEFSVRLPRARISGEMLEEHRRALEKLRDPTTWTSHTVVVIDQSGSMRKTDTPEGVTRTELVWLLLALNLVAKTLQDKERRSSDVLSVVSMRTFGEVLLECRPFDWILYNDLIDIIEESEASGHGNYLPSLDAAERLLTLNAYGGCALSLLFFSDGRPSDFSTAGRMNYPGYFAVQQFARERVERLASEFGRRLTVGAIAIGPMHEDFSILKSFEQAAKEYGSMGVFQEASLCASALSKTITSLTSMISSTMTEMTELGRSRHRQVRKVTREPIKNLGGFMVTSDWHVCKLGYTITWPPTICRVRWDLNGGRNGRGGWILDRDTFHSFEAVGVAFKKKIFGEGAERIVREFREVGCHDYFVGPPLVAKESRFVAEGDDVDKRNFHKVFCKTQQLAQKVANAFNEALGLIPDAKPHYMVPIKFLDCWVYMMDHPELGRQGYLVEKQLDLHVYTYQKWNDNAGRIGRDTLEPRRNVTTSIDRPYNGEEEISLTAIMEGDEYDESSDEGDHDGFGRGWDNCGDELSLDEYTDFNIEDIPQAFSHFSFHHSKGKFLVCDLQGVFNSAEYCFELTDPVIHYRSSRDRRHVYGRTDKGQEGIRAFFNTHRCSKLCQLIRKRYCVDSICPIQVGSEKVF